MALAISFNLTKQQLELFNKKESKLKSLKADFLVEKELRQSTERKLTLAYDEIKDLRQKCSNLQEEVFHLTNNLVIPEDKTLIDTAALNDIEGMFSKFNTFLTALSNLGISNTEKLHKADIKKIEQMLEDI